MDSEAAAAEGERQIAAIDLGSNSFHMVVALTGPERRLTIIDRIKDPVRLAAGLDERGYLSPESCDQALECLGRFAERLGDMPPESVRAVGTNTFRKARNRLDFLEVAQEVLGHRIDIISGREEARLIYAGVSSEFDRPGRRLVLDIGGGSTEMILGEGRTPIRLESLYMGCVSWSQRFFPDGRIDPGAMHRAVTAARQELGGVMRAYQHDSWDYALGSSGTIKSIESLLLEDEGVPGGTITARGLKHLWRKLQNLRHIDQLRASALPDNRKPVFLGGLAILMAAFKSLRIHEMTWVNAALKEGLLVEIDGRMHHEDVREATVQRLAERLQVDRPHSRRVAATALAFFDEVASAWGLDPQSHRPLLRWAAKLHEAGQFISYSGYHKHGSYMLLNADLPGFSRQEQATLAAMVLGHRGKLDPARFRELTPGTDEAAARLAILLRLAATLHRIRSRKPPAVHLEIAGGGRELLLRYPDHWLADRPLSAADLEVAANALAGLGYKLKYQ